MYFCNPKFMKMKALKSYDIKFTGLKNGKHRYKFHLDREFFEHFDNDDFESCDIDIVIELNKSDRFLEFNIHNSGTVNVPCDISGEMFDQKIEGDLDFIVKFGETYNDDREDLIYIPYHSHFFNIAQQIYESVVLSVPVKRIHPDIASGKKIAGNAKYIINYDDNNTQPGQNSEKKEIDPRWAALKKILTDKKS